MDPKRKARLEALGISVQSITPELAAKWGTLMSPGQRRGQSKPAAPEGQPNPANQSSKALPAGEQLPCKAGLLTGNTNEEGVQENLRKRLLTRQPVTQEKKDPIK